MSAFTWAKVEPAAAAAGKGTDSRRAGHCLVLYGNCLWAFGGERFDGRLTNELLCFDLGTKVWRSVVGKDSEGKTLEEGKTDGKKPLAREGHSGIVFGDSLYIYGGCSINSCFDDLWRFDFKTESWHLLKPEGKGPGKVTKHSAVVCQLPAQKKKKKKEPAGGDDDDLKKAAAAAAAAATLSVMCVYGGWDNTDAFKSLTYYDFKGNEWLSSSSSSSSSALLHESTERIWHSANVVKGSKDGGDGGQRMVIFAGENKNIFLQNDMFVCSHSFSKWEQEKAKEGRAPADRYGHSALVMANRFLLVFGGYGGEMTAYNDLHQYSFAKQRWRCVPADKGAPPKPCFGQRAVGEDSKEQFNMYVFGGKSIMSEVFGDVFRLSVDVKASVDWEEAKFDAKAAAGGVTEWTCGVCTVTGNQAANCTTCGSPRPASTASPAAPSSSSGPWACQVCTLQNDGKSNACSVCGSPRP